VLRSDDVFDYFRIIEDGIICVRIIKDLCGMVKAEIDSLYNVVLGRQVVIAEYDTRRKHHIAACEPAVARTRLLTDNLTSDQGNSSEIIESSVDRCHRRNIKTVRSP